MYVAQRMQAFVGNGVSVPDPRPWHSGTDLLRDDFTVSESGLECDHVQNGQSFTWPEMLCLGLGYTFLQTKGCGKAAVCRCRREIRSQASHIHYLYHDLHLHL